MFLFISFILTAIKKKHTHTHEKCSETRKDKTTEIQSMLWTEKWEKYLRTRQNMYIHLYFVAIYVVCACVFVSIFLCPFYLIFVVVVDSFRFFQSLGLKSSDCFLKILSLLILIFNHCRFCHRYIKFIDIVIIFVIAVIVAAAATNSPKCACVCVLFFIVISLSIDYLLLIFSIMMRSLIYGVFVCYLFVYYAITNSFFTWAFRNTKLRTEQTRAHFPSFINKQKIEWKH